MENYAAIDLGTNSCRLLIATGSEKPIPVARELRTTRLGQDLAVTGVISDTSIRKTLQCLQEFKQVMSRYEVKKYRVVATNAVREAANQQDFITKAGRETGLKVEVISGEEEARLSYSGVASALALPVPPLVVDLGGGSTEFMYYGDDYSYWTSLSLGAVRATELNMPAGEIVQSLQPVIIHKQRFVHSPLVVVGGTATTAVAIKLGLKDYRPELVQGQVVTRVELADLYNLVERMPLNLRRRLPGLQPERADIISYGLLILLLIVDNLGKKEIIVSESDLLEGIILNLMKAGQP
jgi:exopolyphosphatase/guanosine-5'-triphosphate,3'-diphosphate pyrophosphatase